MQAAEKTKNIYELPLQENPFIADVRVTIRDDLRTRLKNIEQALVKHNTQLKKMGTREENPLPQWEKLIVPVTPGQPLDGKLFQILREKRVQNIVKSERQAIKARMWHLGCVLRTLHNTLYFKFDKIKDPPLLEDKPFSRLEVVTRKCFQLVQYATRELIQDTIDVEDASVYDGNDSVLDKIDKDIKSLRDKIQAKTRD
jgi:hypothetical protein